MAKEIIIEDNSVLNKFFRNNKKHETLIKNNITNHLPQLLDQQSYKIKTVAGCRYQGQTIYEYKIPLDKNTNCRVAYVHQGEAIVVFFISNTIVKREFTKLLIKTKDITNG